MPIVGVITGVRTEAEALRPIAGHPDGPILRYSGARPIVAEASVDELLNLEVDGLLSFGSAGGLDPAFEPGELVVANQVIGGSNGSWQCDTNWVEQLEQRLNISSKPVYGSDTMVSVAKKQELHTQTSACAVDMESHIVAKKASEKGIPFAVLRAVVDPHDFEIPGWVSDSIRPNGTVSLLPIISGMCMFPWHIGRLASLGANNKRAMNSLGGAVGILGPGLGLFSF